MALFWIPNNHLQRKSDGIYHINLTRTEDRGAASGSSCYLAEASVTSSRNTGQGAVLNFAAAPEATPTVGRFVPGTLAEQIQAAFLPEPRLLVATDPRADHQPLTEASYVNLLTVAPWDPDSPLRHEDTAIVRKQQQGSSLGAPGVVDAGPGSSARARTVSQEQPSEVSSISISTEMLRRQTEKEEQAAAAKAVPKEEFQGVWTAPAVPSKVTEGSLPTRQFPAEDGAPARHEGQPAAPTARAAERVSEPQDNELDYAGKHRP
ncbi:40S ribosomal protein SA-like [Camelus ferus]|uniref:40S ribosomal protein SA n=1 Tax=Camelus ferus TaxID=419612 RepID=A0A8B8TDG5_CAMFR|nr:40S ribosomal protein SA-like [Camelus ferus]